MDFAYRNSLKHRLTLHSFRDHLRLLLQFAWVNYLSRTKLILLCVFNYKSRVNWATDTFGGYHLVGINYQKIYMFKCMYVYLSFDNL